MYVYAVSPAVNLASSATPNTEVLNQQILQVTGNFGIMSQFIQGKGAGLTAISGIVFRTKRWTTAGSIGSGTAMTPAPRRLDMPAATETASNNSGGAITTGSVNGSYQLVIGCGAAGPGGWVAPNPDAYIEVRAGTSDDLSSYSASGTASLNFETMTEIFE